MSVNSNVKAKLELTGMSLEGQHGDRHYRTPYPYVFSMAYYTLTIIL